MISPPARSSRGYRLAWPAITILLTVVLVLTAHRELSAEPFPKDPVETFRQALLLENNKSIINYKNRLENDPIALKLALDFRKANLKKAADGLKTTSDISRALMLIDWPRSSRNYVDPTYENRYDRGAREIEREVREELAKRLVKEVRAAIQEEARSEADAARQIATANLVGETMNSVGDAQDDNLLLYKDLDPLAKDLARLVDAPNPLVRNAAARALGRFPNSPKIAAEALQQLLKPTNPVATRRAAADGLLSLVQTVSSNLPVRSSEPGVSVQETRRVGSVFTLDAVAALLRQAVKAASTGLEDPSVEVRRLCASALKQSAETLAYEIKILVPVSASEISLPPTERATSPNEKERIEERREQINESIQLVMPTLRMYRNQGPALLRAALDPDPEVRLAARRTLDSLAQARELIEKLRDSVPPKATIEKKGDADKDAPDLVDPNKRGKDARLPRVSKLLKTVSYLPGQDKVEKKDAAEDKDVPDLKKEESDEDKEDKDEDPIGKLLKFVGEGIVRSGFRDPNAPARRASVEAIEAMGTAAEEFIPRLVELLKDPDVFVRWISARALGKMAPRRAELVVPALVGMLDDVDLDPRSTAAKALGQYGPSAASAVPALSARLHKGDAEFRLAVMKALEGIGTDAASTLPNLTRSLKDTDPRVRAAAATLIGKFGKLAADYVEALRALTDDRDSEVRKAASAAILNIVLN